MVRLLWVTMMNWDWSMKRSRTLMKRPMLVSSRGASSSSRTQKGLGFDHVDGEEEGDGGHGLLAAGEEGDGLEAFSGGLGDDFDAGVEGVLVVDEEEVGLGAGAEEFGEHFAEVGADLGEGVGEEDGGFGVDALDEGEEFGLGADEVVVLALEEGVAFLEFLEFLDGVEVDGADGIELALEVGEGGGDEVPVGGGVAELGSGIGEPGSFLAGGFGGGRAELGLGAPGGRAPVLFLFEALGEGGLAFGLGGLGFALFGDAGLEGVDVGLEGVEVGVVALGDALGEVFELEVELGGGDFLAAGLLVEAVDFLAGVAEGGFGFGDGVGEALAGGGLVVELLLELRGLGFVLFDGLGELGVLGGGVFDALAEVFDFLLALLAGVAEFVDAGAHGVLLLLGVFVARCSTARAVWSSARRVFSSSRRASRRARASWWARSSSLWVARSSRVAGEGGFEFAAGGVGLGGGEAEFLEFGLEGVELALREAVSFRARRRVPSRVEVSTRCCWARSRVCSYSSRAE